MSGGRVAAGLERRSAGEAGAFQGLAGRYYPEPGADASALQGAEAPAGGGGGSGACPVPVRRAGGRTGGQGTGPGRLRVPCGPAGEEPGRVPPPVLVRRHGGGGRPVGGLEPQPDEIGAVPDAEEIEGLSEKGGALS